MTATLELPTPETAQEAQDALRELARIPRPSASRHVRLRADGDETPSVTVPRVAFDLLLEILGQMANGNAVTVVQVHAELTTQQAADLLNVSRPFLVSLLEKGVLPFTKVGTHRRVRFADLAKYRDEQNQRSKAALDELTRQAQETGLGY